MFLSTFGFVELCLWRKNKNIEIILSTVCPNNFELQNQILYNSKSLILNNNSICYLDEKYFKQIYLKAKYNSDINNLFSSSIAISSSSNGISSELRILLTFKLGLILFK